MRPLAILLFLCITSLCHAQISGDNAYMNNGIVETGVNNCGVYTTPDNPPGGYHPTNDTYFSMVADTDMEGWDEGEPAFCGDYLSAGTPVDGWSLQIDSMIWTNGEPFCYGDFDILGEISSYTATDSFETIIWDGDLPLDLVHVHQSTTLKTGDLFFTTVVTITNNDTEPIHDVYYKRNIDPDNDFYGAFSFETTNTVISNPPDDYSAYATAVGELTGCYLGLGAKDARARATIGNFYTVDVTPADTWLGLDSCLLEGTFTDDLAMSLTFKIGTIAPGASDSIAFVFVFSPDSATEALEEGDLTPLICTWEDSITMSAVSFTSATANWDGLEEHNYTLLIENMATGDIDTVAPATNPYAFTDLDSCTQYAIRIMTICSEDSSTSEAFYFSTSCIPDGIVSITANQFALYPDPAEHSITISGDVFYQYEIHTITGTLVKSQSSLITGNEIIDVQNYAPGIYLMLISFEGQVVAKRFVVR